MSKRTDEALFDVYDKCTATDQYELLRTLMAGLAEWSVAHLREWHPYGKSWAICEECLSIMLVDPVLGGNCWSCKVEHPTRRNHPYVTLADDIMDELDELMEATDEKEKAV